MAVTTRGPVEIPGAAQRAFALYTRLLAPLLAGYLLLDKAFAYLHLPGTPLYVGEIVLGVGVLAAVLAIGDLPPPSETTEKFFFALGLLCLWGLILAIPGSVSYGLNAVRDSALWYYSFFAFLTYAVLIRTPTVLRDWINRFGRFTPWLLAWLPMAIVLAPLMEKFGLKPGQPGAAGLVLDVKSGDSAIAALLGLGYLWFFPRRFSTAGRAVWSALALVVIALAGTQNRGGFLAVIIGAIVGLVFHPDRRHLVKRNVALLVVGVALSLLMPQFTDGGLQGRQYSAAQLIENVLSIADPNGSGALSSTAKFRTDLWTRILNKQVTDGHLIDGMGFGPNLAADVGVYAGQSDSFRSPHNSHLDILARMGLIGLFLWVVMWSCWYRRMITGCRRLLQRGFHSRRHVAIICQMVVTAVMVSSYFDPQLEGPQVAIPLWALVGIGLAAVSERLDHRGADVSDPVAPRR